MTLDGTSIDECQNAAVLFLNPEPQLTTSDGTVYSTSEGVASQAFVPSTTVGAISTSWQSINGTLQRNNDSFVNHAASFCLENDIIEAYFTKVPPSASDSIELSTVPREYFGLLTSQS